MSPSRAFPLLVAFSALTMPAALFAQGSPPMNTDDPGTPGKGRWEINLGAAHARAGGDRTTAAPIVDVGYGFSENAELSYVVEWLGVKAPGQRRVTGLSNSTLGLKWRFQEAAKGGFAASVAPALEFNNPGSNSERKGLADEGATFILPFQFERDLGGVTLNVEAGRSFHFKRADEWFYGVALGGEVSPGVDLGVEVYGDALKKLDRSGLLLNVGAAIEVNKANSLHLAIGRELHRHGGPRATFVGYVGWQFRH